MARRAFSVLLSPGGPPDAADRVIAYLAGQGAVLRGRGQATLSFDIAPDTFARLFGAGQGAGTADQIPPALRGLVDLISLPPRHLLFDPNE